MQNLFNNFAQLASSGYLFRVTDNQGATLDRLTVLFSDGDALSMSETGQGVSMWCERVDPATLEEWVETGEAVDLEPATMSDEMKAHILARVNHAWRDYLETLPDAAAPNRESAAINEGLTDCGGVGLYRKGDALWVRLDGDESDDRGPFTDPAEALRATLPDEYSLSGPEYHSPAFPANFHAES